MLVNNLVTSNQSLIDFLFSNVYDTIISIFLGILIFIGFLLRNWFKTLLLEIKDGDYKSANSTDNIIYTKLGELLEHYKASRVWLARLHNGVSFSNGESFKKYSITHMVVQDGISWPKYYPKDFQDIPLSHAYELLHLLFKQKTINLKVDSFSDNGYFRNVLTSNSVTDIHAILIEYKDQPIGFIGLTWTKHNPSKGTFDGVRIGEIAKSLSILLKRKKNKFLFFK